MSQTSYPPPTAIIFEVLFGPQGPNFGLKVILTPNSKICTFRTKLHSMDFPGPQQSKYDPFDSTWTLKSLLEGSKFSESSFTNIYNNIGVCALSKTPAFSFRIKWFWRVDALSGNRIWAFADFLFDSASLQRVHKRIF